MAKTKKSFIERIKPTGAKDLIRKIILLVCICVFCYSAYNLASIFLEYKSMDDSNKEVEETYVTENTEQKNSYKTIDFEALLARNSDVKGWIDIPDTKVSYPIVQGETNDTYIHSDIDKKEFRAGSIFIASENKNPFTDLNTVIYGHNMKNGSRFHDLRYFVENDYFQAHPLIYVYLPDGTVNIYDAFASTIIDANSNLYAKGINYKKYVKSIQDVAKVYKEVSDKEAPLTMLSTCYNGTDNRYVVYGRLKENVKTDVSVSRVGGK